MQNKTTIEINGRVYDAKSGALLSGPVHGNSHQATAHGPHHAAAAAQPHHPHAAPAHQQVANQPPKKQFVDGFVRGMPLPANPSIQHKKTYVRQHVPAPASQAKPKPVHEHHSTIDAAAVHQTQHRSATLMRKAVKHPSPEATAHRILPKRGTPVKTTHGDVSVSARSRLAAAANDKLSARAGSIPKSTAISRFGEKGADDSRGNAAYKPISAELRPIPLKSPPPSPVSHHTANTHVQHAANNHANHAATSSHHQSAATHTSQAPASYQRSHAMLQRGLMAANSHEQRQVAYKQSTRRTLLSIGAGTAAVLLLAGYIAYINVPNVAMRVAASKAGFSASMPDNPPGYSMKGPIKYSPGRITFSLRSNSNDKTVAITERSSNWDSQSLLKNHVRPAANGEYEAVEASGRTLYMYGSSVTWVHGGVWYQIDGNDQLGRDQLVKLATSM